MARGDLQVDCSVCYLPPGAIRPPPITALEPQAVVMVSDWAASGGGDAHEAASALAAAAQCVAAMAQRRRGAVGAWGEAVLLRVPRDGMEAAAPSGPSASGAAAMGVAAEALGGAWRWRVLLLAAPDALADPSGALTDDEWAALSRAYLVVLDAGAPPSPGLDRGLERVMSPR